MRSFLLSAILSGGVLGATFALPASAKALPPIRMTQPFYSNSYRVGPYSYYNAFTAPTYSWYNNAFGSGYSYITPAAYHTNVTPYSITQQWQGHGARGWSYNPWFGLSYTVTTPATWGYSYSPYYHYFQSYAIPSMTYTVPAGYIIP